MEKFIALVVGKMFYDLGVEYRLILKVLTDENLIEIKGGVISRLDNAVTKEEELIGMSQGKVHAVKAYKARTGLPLINAKYTVENHFVNHNLKFYNYNNG